MRTGVEEEDVRRRESWRMGLEGEHQAMGWDKREGTKGNRVWGSEKQKNKWEVEGARECVLMWKGKRKMMERPGKQVAGAGEEDELRGKRNGNQGWRNVCGKGRGAGDRQVKRGRVVPLHGVGHQLSWVLQVPPGAGTVQTLGT